jgi:hypothetical protein
MYKEMFARVDVGGDHIKSARMMPDGRRINPA